MSSNVITFVMGCLRVTPIDRIYFSGLLCYYTANPDEESEGALLLLKKADLIKVGSFP